MLESTFLARSFGDQGVRLKTRKESRTMLYVDRFCTVKITLTLKTERDRYRQSCIRSLIVG